MKKVNVVTTIFFVLGIIFLLLAVFIPEHPVIFYALMGVCFGIDVIIMIFYLIYVKADEEEKRLKANKEYADRIRKEKNIMYIASVADYDKGFDDCIKKIWHHMVEVMHFGFTYHTAQLTTDRNILYFYDMYLTNGLEGDDLEYAIRHAVSGTPAQQDKYQIKQYDSDPKVNLRKNLTRIAKLYKGLSEEEVEQQLTKTN